MSDDRCVDKFLNINALSLSDRSPSTLEFINRSMKDEQNLQFVAAMLENVS